MGHAKLALATSSNKKKKKKKKEIVHRLQRIEKGCMGTFGVTSCVVLDLDVLTDGFDVGNRDAYGITRIPARITWAQTRHEKRPPNLILTRVQPLLQ
jgi:hypothetical protein